MGSKNRGKLLLLVKVIVITSSHIAFSQKSLKPINDKNIVIIKKISDYNSIVKQDSLQKMVLVKRIIPGIFLDLKYGTKENFTGQVLYNHPMAFLRIEAANALKRANSELHDLGYAIKIYDAYRPYSITKRMWQLVHDRRYVANPAKGSAHNRGSAVDITLVKLNGDEVQMPTPFDDFSEKAGHNYNKLPAQVIKNRDLLKMVMRKHGFAALPTEWWHYILPETTKKFALLDLSFEDLLRTDK